jgi:hypothetical protein
MYIGCAAKRTKTIDFLMEHPNIRKLLLKIPFWHVIMDIVHKPFASFVVASKEEPNTVNRVYYDGQRRFYDIAEAYTHPTEGTIYIGTYSRHTIARFKDIGK